VYVTLEDKQNNFSNMGAATSSKGWRARERNGKKSSITGSLDGKYSQEPSLCIGFGTERKKGTFGLSRRKGGRGLMGRGWPSQFKKRQREGGGSVGGKNNPE